MLVLAIIMVFIIPVQYSVAQYYQPAPALPPPQVFPAAPTVSPNPVQVNTAVTFNGDPTSCCPTPSYTYGWTLMSKPAGSSATLSSTTAQNPTLTPDFVGSYAVCLVVTDSYARSSPQQCATLIANAPPSPPTPPSIALAPSAQPPSTTPSTAPSTTPGTAQAGTPNGTGGGALQCPPGYKYDPNVGQCVAQGGGALNCPPGYKYDPNVGQCVAQGGGAQVPSWIKNNAKWWSSGQIGDDDFLKGIQYLVQNGIINAGPNTMPPGQQTQSLTESSECYIKIVGINGEYNEAGLTGAIKVQSYGWTSNSKSFAGSQASAVNQMYFVHSTDKASPQLYKAIANGNHFNNGQLLCRKADGEQQPYLSYTMSNVIISSFSQINNGGELPAEKIWLNFASSQTLVDTYNLTPQNQLNPQPLPPSPAGAIKPAVPSWIKNNAKWWSEGQISEDEFLKGIQYLIQNGIINHVNESYNTLTNVAKSKHDASMAAIQNTR